MKKFYDYRRDGITQSLLQTFMTCRQKAKWYLEGWSAPYPSMALTYGTIIHSVLEEIYKRVQNKKLSRPPSLEIIKNFVKEVERQWRIENPNANFKALENLEMSCLIAEATLPIYFKHWYQEDFRNIKWRSLEQQFAIPYKTKDGRETIIRGKKDGVFGDKSIKLFETKTKSIVDVDALIETLWFEFQVNLYLWALRQIHKKDISGVTYNIIRKTSLYKSANESMLSYATRIAKDIKKRPAFYFIRLDISVTTHDMKKFEVELENLIMDFMNWQDGISGNYKNTQHCIDRYGRCNYLQLCSSKNFSGFIKRKSVFKELEDY